MIKLEEHRIYKHLSHPFKLVGLTLDELLLGISGFFCALVLLEGGSGTFGMLGTLIGVYALKKGKKQISGGDVKSFLFWKGWWPKPKSYPCPHKKEYRA